jgi:hypothetical protein
MCKRFISAPVLVEELWVVSTLLRNGITDTFIEGKSAAA